MVDKAFTCVVCKFTTWVVFKAVNSAAVRDVTCVVLRLLANVLVSEDKLVVDKFATWVVLSALT